jgi:hypothetical protein
MRAVNGARGARVGRRHHQVLEEGNATAALGWFWECFFRRAKDACAVILNVAVQVATSQPEPVPMEVGPRANILGSQKSGSK